MNTIKQRVAALDEMEIVSYVEAGPDNQFEIAREYALEWDLTTMDDYDAVEIAMDDRATAMGIF